MGMRGASFVVFLVLALVAGPASATLEDGLPRPTGYPLIPSASYGPTPQVAYNGVDITCKWYGFSHILYPLQGAQCNAGMRRVLSNATLVPPSTLSPYIYYFSTFYVFDQTTNASYCLYGCFDLSSSSSAPPPSSSLFAPPPTPLATPPPSTPLLTPPPPVARPPPPLLASPPPPVSLSNPPPATLFSPPPPSTLPGSATSPPPPPGTDGTRIINLNAAPGFLQPAAFVSVLLSGALLLILAAF